MEKRDQAANAASHRRVSQSQQSAELAANRQVRARNATQDSRAAPLWQGARGGAGSGYLLGRRLVLAGIFERLFLEIAVRDQVGAPLQIRVANEGVGVVDIF
jgi:hypothetical protein